MKSGPPHRDEDFLVLSTIHSAKGQEWRSVFVLNVVDGCIPSDLSTGSSEEIEEERRLLYVAMTRARDELCLIAPQKFFVHGQPRGGDRHWRAEPVLFRLTCFPCSNGSLGRRRRRKTSASSMALASIWRRACGRCGGEAARRRKRLIERASNARRLPSPPTCAMVRGNCLCVESSDRPMQDRRELERAKIDGRAAFAGVGYLMGVGLIFLLGRVGAPDGLVRTLGPLLALFAVGLVGVLTRSTRAPAFFVADRAIPEPYAGLAFAAIAAGLIICLGPAGDAPLPPAGVAIGLAISALVVGPFLRACGASAPSDLLATRFPNPLVRIATTALLLAIGVFTAAAGFAATVDTLVWLFSLSRGGAVAIVAGVLVLAVAPGGIASLLWSAAGGAGILVIVLALPIVARFFQDSAAIGEAVRETGFWSDAFARGWSSAGVSDPGLSCWWCSRAQSRSQRSRPSQVPRSPLRANVRRCAPARWA